MNSGADNIDALRARIPKKLRFPAAASFVAIPEIARKWGVTTPHARKLILGRYGMTRLDVSGKRGRKVFRVDVGDYYAATLERLEVGILDDPRREQPGLFGDCRQFDPPDDEESEVRRERR